MFVLATAADMHAQFLHVCHAVSAESWCGHFGAR